MFRFSGIWSAFLAAFVSLATLAGPAQADRVTASLTQASKYIDEGVPVKAIEVINTTLSSGQIPADLASKGLLLRAQAQEKLGKHAYALADYNQAIWMQGLSATDKTKAEEGRNRILAKLGVAEGSGKAGAATETSVQATAVKGKAPAPAPAGRSGSDRETWDTEVQTSASEQRTGGIGSIFSGLFGSSDKPQQQKRTVQPVARRVEREPAQPAKAVAQVRTSSVADNDAPAPSAGQELTGGFAIQFAALHSEDKAIFEVNRVEKRYSEWLGGRTPSITIRATSDGGTLYKVIAEPYERGEGVATCELLKTKGVSCMIISR